MVVDSGWAILWLGEQNIQSVGQTLDHHLDGILVPVKMLDLYASIFLMTRLAFLWTIARRPQVPAKPA